MCMFLLILYDNSRNNCSYIRAGVEETESQRVNSWRSHISRSERTGLKPKFVWSQSPALSHYICWHAYWVSFEKKETMFLPKFVLVTSIPGAPGSLTMWSEMMLCAHGHHGDNLIVCEFLCQSGTKEKSWAEKNLRGKSEVCVVKKRNVNPVCLKSHLVLPWAHVNHPILIAFLEVCHTLTWALLYSLVPSCGPHSFLYWCSL